MKRNIAANYVGTLWTAAIQILFVPAYIHYLGMEAYGLIGFYATLQMWLMLLDFGFTPTINREMARFRGGATDTRYIRKLLNTLEVACILMALASFIAVGGGAGWLSKNWFNLHSLSAHEVQISLIAMSGVIVTRWMSNFYRGALQGLQQQVWLNAVWVIFVSLRSIGVIAILAWVSPTLVAYFLYLGAVSIVEVLVMRIGVTRCLPSDQADAPSVILLLKNHLNFAGGMALLSVLGVAISQSDKLILSKLLPLREFGYYALATVMANGLLAVAVPVFNAVTPRLTEDAARGDFADLVRSYRTGTDLLAIFVFPLAGMLIFLGEPLIVAWSGQSGLANHVAPFLALLALGTTFYCLAHMPYGLTLAYAWTRLPVALNAATVAVLVPALVVVVPKYGPMGAAACWVVLNAIGLAVQVTAVHRRFLPKGENRRWIRRTFAYPIFMVATIFESARLLFDAEFKASGRILTAAYILCVVLLSIILVTTIVPTGRKGIATCGALVKRWLRWLNAPPSVPL